MSWGSSRTGTSVHSQSTQVLEGENTDVYSRYLWYCLFDLSKRRYFRLSPSRDVGEGVVGKLKARGGGCERLG